MLHFTYVIPVKQIQTKLKIAPGTIYFAFKLYIVTAHIWEKPLDLEACSITVVFAEENAEGNGFGIDKNIYNRH